MCSLHFTSLPTTVGVGRVFWWSEVRQLQINFRRMSRNETQRIVSKWRMMRIANKLKNLIKKNKRFKQTSIQNVEDIKESYLGKEAQSDTSKDLQNVEQDEVKELTASHTDGWSLVCYSRNGKSLEELNCSCCSVASCDWRYPVSKLVVEWADAITNWGCICVMQLYEGEQVVVSFEMYPGWKLRLPPPRWIMECMRQEW